MPPKEEFEKSVQSIDQALGGPVRKFCVKGDKL